MPCFLIGKDCGTDSMPYHLRSSKFKADRSVFLRKTWGGFTLFWLTKILGLASVIVGIYATVSELEGDNDCFAQANRITQGVLLTISWFIELGFSFYKVNQLKSARADYPKMVGGITDPAQKMRIDTDSKAKNQGPCCAFDTMWPLLFFHIIAAFLGIIGFFVPGLSVRTATIFTTLPPFLLFTGVGMTHEKIDAECENIKGSFIEKVDASGAPVNASDSSGLDPKDAAPACFWVCC